MFPHADPVLVARVKACVQQLRAQRPTSSTDSPSPLVVTVAILFERSAIGRAAFTKWLVREFEDEATFRVVSLDAQCAADFDPVDARDSVTDDTKATRLGIRRYEDAGFGDVGSGGRGAHWQVRIESRAHFHRVLAHLEATVGVVDIALAHFDCTVWSNAGQSTYCLDLEFVKERRSVSYYRVGERYRQRQAQRAFWVALIEDFLNGAVFPKAQAVLVENPKGQLDKALQPLGAETVAAEYADHLAFTLTKDLLSPTPRNEALCAKSFGRKHRYLRKPTMYTSGGDAQAVRAVPLLWFHGDDDGDDGDDGDGDELYVRPTPHNSASTSALARRAWNAADHVGLARSADQKSRTPPDVAKRNAWTLFARYVLATGGDTGDAASAGPRPRQQWTHDAAYMMPLFPTHLPPTLQLSKSRLCAHHTRRDCVLLHKHTGPCIFAAEEADRLRILDYLGREWRYDEATGWVVCCCEALEEPPAPSTTRAVSLLPPTDPRHLHPQGSDTTFYGVVNQANCVQESVNYDVQYVGRFRKSPFRTDGRRLTKALSPSALRFTGLLEERSETYCGVYAYEDGVRVTESLEKPECDPGSDDYAALLSDDEAADGWLTQRAVDVALAAYAPAADTLYTTVTDTATLRARLRKHHVPHRVVAGVVEVALFVDPDDVTPTRSTLLSLHIPRRAHAVCHLTGARMHAGFDEGPYFRYRTTTGHGVEEMDEADVVGGRSTRLALVPPPQLVGPLVVAAETTAAATVTDAAAPVVTETATATAETATETATATTTTVTVTVTETETETETETGAAAATMEAPRSTNNDGPPAASLPPPTPVPQPNVPVQQLLGDLMTAVQTLQATVDALRATAAAAGTPAADAEDTRVSSTSLPNAPQDEGDDDEDTEADDDAVDALIRKALARNTNRRGEPAKFRTYLNRAKVQGGPAVARAIEEAMAVFRNNGPGPTKAKLRALLATRAKKRKTRGRPLSEDAVSTPPKRAKATPIGAPTKTGHTARFKLGEAVLVWCEDAWHPATVMERLRQNQTRQTMYRVQYDEELAYDDVFPRDLRRGGGGR